MQENTKNIEDYYQFLKNRYRKSTSDRYLNATQIYLEMIGGEDEALYMSYSNIMEYINQLRQRDYSPRRIATELAGVKSYHQYLFESKQRLDNPAGEIILQDASRNREIQHQDLFSHKELEQLLQRKNRYKNIQFRNKFIISLYIYQGLSTGDLTRLTPEDIKEDGSVYIKASTKLNARHLSLTQKQMHYAMTYLHKERPQLVKRPTKALFISKLGSVCKTDDFSYLIECQKHLFPTRKLNPKTVRQSVFTNCFKKGMGIREIQLLAGHKYASTTLKYRPTDLGELANSLAQFHPLGGGRI